MEVAGAVFHTRARTAGPGPAMSAQTFTVQAVRLGSTVEHRVRVLIVVHASSGIVLITVLMCLVCRTMDTAALARAAATTLWP